MVTNTNMSVRLGAFNPSAKQKKIVKEIINSGFITEGKYTKMFEEEVQKFIGVKHAIAVTNGTVSLQLIAQYLKYKHGNHMMVCVPATTFPATVNAFLNIGFPTMLCDVGTDLQMDINTLTEEQKKQIRIIVPVSLLGFAPNMDKIMKEAKKYNWIVVEDFAESFGATIKRKKLGSIGDFGSSSFYMSHVIQGGELGIITTNDDEAATIMRSMKNHGRTGSSLLFNHTYIGTNYKTTEFCTGLCWEQLSRVNKIIRNRQFNCEYVTSKLKNTRLKPFEVNNTVSPLGFAILAESEQYKFHICEQLTRHGIESRGMFPCLAGQTAFSGMYGISERYPVSERMEREAFYIGCHQYLSMDDLDFVVKVLNEEI